MGKLLEKLPAEQRVAGLPVDQVLSHYAPDGDDPEVDLPLQLGRIHPAMLA